MGGGIRKHLRALYGEAVADEVSLEIEARLARLEPKKGLAHEWGPEDALLIVYADAIQQAGEAPLRTLGRFLDERLHGIISQVHLLPFFPYTSDDGFAVSDYRAVDPNHGGWDEIERLSEDFDLVFDLVINHASSAHPSFQEFLRDEAPGNRYFMTAELDQDVSAVTRPRASPLLQTYETAGGPRHVWCTFSRDQVDWDFSNPEVLLEFVDIVLGYLAHGASWLRLDAIAYLWKVAGTSCVHLPQAHAVVKLLRSVVERVNPGAKLLTETNVPLQENLSYFGEQDEAHIVYNFSLPPLLTHALVTGYSEALTRWCQSLPALPSGCTFLNFVASHDGIGLRPAEGLLSEEQLGELIHCVEAFGGKLTKRTRPDGSLGVYEANISLFDALGGTLDGHDRWQVDRFLVAQGVMMSLAGVPAFYYNTLLAAPNDHEGLERTGRYRSLNRKKWEFAEVERRLSDPSGAPASVFSTIAEMLTVRRGLSAFHPEAPQTCLSVDDRAFVLARGEEGLASRVLCVFNLSRDELELSRASLAVSPSASLGLRYSRGVSLHENGTVRCSAYGMAWLEFG